MTTSRTIIYSHFLPPEELNVKLYWSLSTWWGERYVERSDHSLSFILPVLEPLLVQIPLPLPARRSGQLSSIHYHVTVDLWTQRFCCPVPPGARALTYQNNHDERKWKLGPKSPGPELMQPIRVQTLLVVLLILQTTNYGFIISVVLLSTSPADTAWRYCALSRNINDDNNSWTLVNRQTIKRGKRNYRKIRQSIAVQENRFAAPELYFDFFLTIAFIGINTNLNVIKDYRDFRIQTWDPKQIVKSCKDSLLVETNYYYSHFCPFISSRQ